MIFLIVFFICFISYIISLFFFIFCLASQSIISKSKLFLSFAVKAPPNTPMKFLLRDGKTVKVRSNNMEPFQGLNSQPAEVTHRRIRLLDGKSPRCHQYILRNSVEDNNLDKTRLSPNRTPIKHPFKLGNSERLLALTDPKLDYRPRRLARNIPSDTSNKLENHAVKLRTAKQDPRARQRPAALQVQNLRTFDNKLKAKGSELHTSNLRCDIIEYI